MIYYTNFKVHKRSSSLVSKSPIKKNRQHGFREVILAIQQSPDHKWLSTSTNVEKIVQDLDRVHFQVNSISVLLMIFLDFRQHQAFLSRLINWNYFYSLERILYV
jgi:hypothetical protein